MNLIQLFRNIWPYVRPYKWLVILALILTFVGSLAAQVNAWVLRYAVDAINGMVEQGRGLTEGVEILLTITIILFGKEILNTFIQFGQKYYGEKLRIFISRDLAQLVIEKILTYQMAFFSTSNNQAGKLQTRIDRGVESLTRLVQNFFIDILPLFANSLVALIMMFNANFYVGLVGLCITPIYYYVSQKQASKLQGARRNIKELRENKSQGILGIIESISVIKSFNRERIEESKQMELQTSLTDKLYRAYRCCYHNYFDGLFRIDRRNDNWSNHVSYYAFQQRFGSYSSIAPYL